jgi:glycosyltransferase involved in cell wall biosynthesis/FMN phosphatase YigB (HAD superfamily)
LFDVAFYTNQNPDWHQAAATPLGHYVFVGAMAGASPHPLFDPVWYAAQAPSITQNDLFRHFLTEGFAKGHSPHPSFDPAFYLAQSPALGSQRVNPLTHFVQVGWAMGISPHRAFDVSWYAERHPVLAAQGVNPLVHFLTIGAQAGENPHPGIDLVKYRDEQVGGPSDLLGAFLHLVTKGTAHITDDALTAARETAASEKSALLPSFVAHSILDLENFGLFCSEEDRAPAIQPNAASTQLIEAIGAARRISFDIWDTLLRRDCHPDEIKLQSARFLALNAKAFLRKQAATPVDLLQLRLESEATVAREDHEFRFNEALDVWLWRTLIPTTPPAVLTHLRNALLAHEFAAERRATRADFNAEAVLKATAGRASYASDFYMPGDFMDRLLDSHGIGKGFVSRYVSCDTFETKRGGQLFDRLLGEGALSPQECLHIGDNLSADVEVPRKKGIRAFHYLSPIEESRKEWFEGAFVVHRKGDPSLHHRRILALLEDLASAEADPSVSAGIRLAPLAFGFCLAAAEGALAAGAERLWFFTREGAFLKQVHEEIRRADPFNIDLPEGELLEVSRLATFGPSLAELSPSGLMRLWTLYSTQSFDGLGASLNLDGALVQQTARRHGIEPGKPIRYPWKDASILAALGDKDFVAAAKKRLTEQRGLLRAYLTDRGFEPGSAPRHCVDIGWRGTIQDNITLVSGSPTIGWYLALFGFLNAQPPLTQKHGWLGDDNQPDQAVDIGEVAGFEMLFNAPGGSVKEYARIDGQVKALRTAIAGEEAVIGGAISAIQAGMLRAVVPLSDYTRLHGLIATDLVGLARQIARSLSARPPVPLADAFSALEHNEIFGTGGIEKIHSGHPVAVKLAGKERGALLSVARSALQQVRWPAATLRRSDTQDWLRKVSPAQRAALPSAFNLAHGPALLRSTGDRFAVYAPAPIRGSGGHRTLFNVASRMARLGWKLEVFLEGVGEGVEVAENYLDGTPAVIHSQWHRHIPSDIALATIAHSARFVAELPDVRHRAYLVQDREALFNPISDVYLRNEASYTYGLRHITIGNWLTHVLQREYQSEAAPAGLGVDTNLYCPRPTIPRESAVCFLYQPDKPRRAPQHGIDALRLLKQAMPEVTIYVYGSNLPIQLDFPVVNLGLVLDLQQLAELYARCKVGLCISASNPSRIPFEMMAAGCVPVDLYRYNNLLDHRDGTVMLAHAGEYSLALAMQTLLQNESQWRQRSTACISEGAERSLDWELEAAANHLLDLNRGTPCISAWPFDYFYGEAPVVAPEEDRPAVHRFLRHQFALLGETFVAPHQEIRLRLASR